MNLKMMHAMMAAMLAAAPGLADASTVKTSVTTSGSGSNVKTTVTITVTAAAGESIRDFHIYPTPDKTRINGNSTFGQPDGWGTPTGSGKNDTGKHWKANPGKVGFTTTGTFTITIPGQPQDSVWSYFRWITTSDGAKDPPAPGQPGYVDGGTTSPSTPGGGQIPVVAIALRGSPTVTIGTTAIYTLEGGFAPNQTMLYTVRASLSLDANDPDQVSAAGPLPDSWGIKISTSSSLRTTQISEGVWQATYSGSGTNRVLVTVPFDGSLIGRTVYLKVVFANGDSTAPFKVTIVPGE